MSFQSPITIAEAIRNIEQNRYLLPSIQREFVWRHEKIEWLFDSIMRNYPISSFLFWRVEGDTKKQFKFYKFIHEFRQKYKTHNEEFTTHNDFTAVLDGQQRLTSLYIGLCGSYAYRRPRLNEENSERVYPTRKLYLNVSNSLEEQEDGRIFEFKFLTDTDLKNSDNIDSLHNSYTQEDIDSRLKYGKIYLTESKDKKTCWFKVSDVYELSGIFQFNQYLASNKLANNQFASETLSKLQEAIHSKPIINFYLETEQDIDKALNIFTRVNSGGVPLNLSDLIMSMAVAHWKEKDARKEIHNLTDNIRDKGFSISKDFVLKSFLYLHSKDIKFKVSNFSIANAKDFEKEWNIIRDNILTVFDLVKSFGFSDATLTSNNALLPIIYYLYHRKIEKDFHTKTEYSDDREIIKKWLQVSLVKRVFGGTSDSVLSQIRQAFTNNVADKPLQEDFELFPTDAINSKIRKDIGISEEFIESLLLTQKDDQYAFSLLALLYPDLDYKNNNFHKDHLHPASGYGNLSDELKGKYGWQTYNSLKNLQMLDANENMSKNDKTLEEWVKIEIEAKDRGTFLSNHLIPDLSFKSEDFDSFIVERTKILTERLKSILT